MKPLSMSVLLVAAFAASTAHGAEPEPPTLPDTSESTRAVIPGLYTPSAITPSAREFIERCNDEAFAKTRYPKGLADQCERLLGFWHGEARAQETAFREARIPNYDRALRISTGGIQPLNTN